MLRVAACLPLAADVHPNVEGGVAVDKAFQVGDVDNINLFNGSLTLTLPLGPSYPVGGSLSYGLTLVYNSNPWYFTDDATAPPNTYTLGSPNPCSNAGLGWRVSLGRLGSPCISTADTTTGAVGTVYDGPDGSQHVFYPTLHDGEVPVTGVTYSRDGSYLRLRDVGAGEHELDFPDGTTHHFRSDGRLSQILDPFGNQVAITYGTLLWTITDSRGRTQQIFFRSDLPSYPETVDRVVVPSFGGGLATYQFQYKIQTITRGYPNRDLNVSSNVTVPFLTGVTLPDGSSYGMGLSDYFITSSPMGAMGDGVFGSGSIVSLTLPTLGRIEWSYQSYGFPQGSAQKVSRQKNYGVATRTTRDASGAVLGRWIYGTALTPDVTSGSQELVNTVTDPFGTRTERHFSVSLHNLYAGDWNVYDYGAQLSRYTSLGSPPSLFLSSQTYDAGNRLLCSEYVAYERDQAGLGSLPDAANLNRRVVKSRTVYEDDGGSYADLTSSNFDGLGHYRVQQTGGSGFPGSLVRTQLTNFNAGLGTYAIDAASNTTQSGIAVPTASAPWALSTYNQQWEAENGVTAFIEYCFFSGSTTVARRRVHRLDGAAQDAADLLTLYALDGAGNVSSEKSYGGDLQGGLPVGSNVCTVSPTAPPEYEVDSTYQGGVLATSQATGTTFKSVDRDIDISTGLVQRSRDSAGVATVYGYDPMGRLTSSQTGQSALTTYTYTPAASASALAHLHVEQSPSGVQVGQRPVRDLYFDAFGRLAREEMRMPDGSVSPRAYAYDALGRKSAVSEQGNPALLTQTTYDPFNRPLSIAAPDGHSTTFTYAGVRQLTRTVAVGEQYDAAHARVNEFPQPTTEVYDRQGRLYQMTEPLGGGVTTTYGYDVGNRLSQVSTPALVSGSTVIQTRSFNYDLRGFLLSESHPEKGSTVTHSGYDSRGHATRQVDGGNDLTYTYDTAERLTRVRKTGTAASCTAGGTNCIKQLTYGTVNSGGDRRQGKLIQGERWNFPLLGGTTHVERITTAYTYAGVDGRLSQRDITLTPDGDTASGAHEAFTQSWTYDDLGHVAGETYPACNFTACTGSPARGVSYTYTTGLLTALPGYTGTVPGQATGVGITYQPNGLVSQVAHSNGVVWSQLPDANGLARPGGFTSALGATTLWSTGAYGYDGAGNVTQIGASYYLYDNVSRLGTASFSTLPLGGGTPLVQGYSYDPFGNLTALTGANGRNLPTSPATNHLTTPGSIYDSAGNLTGWNGAIYEYDALNQLRHYLNGAEEWLYMYDADDERLWSFKAGATPRFDRWTLRGLDNQVRRDYEVSGFAWSDWTHGNTWEDFVYRGGPLLAGYYSGGQQRHLDLDHLGTPRLVTNFGSAPVAYHAYYPYGEEATAFNQDTERLKFTGHERDLASPAGAGDDLDYMHARHYSPTAGRFLVVDALDGAPGNPQTWNRYAYVRDNPLMHNDPDGHETADLYVIYGVTVRPSDSAGFAFVTATTADSLFLGGLSFRATLSLAAVDFGPQALFVLAGGGGYLVGTLGNAVPGVSTYITDQLGLAIEPWFMAENNKQTKAVVSGLLKAAAKDLAKIGSAGGPEKDPAGNHHRAEIKNYLDRAKSLAERLPGKVRDTALRAIRELADQAGVRLK
jgi:RHS repeat-associated protein